MWLYGLFGFSNALARFFYGQMLSCDARSVRKERSVEEPCALKLIPYLAAARTPTPSTGEF